MCAPLIDADGRSFGAIQIDTVNYRGRFREEDLRVFVAVATQASIAFDNARMHETALRQREIERDLELADQIQRSFLPAGPPEVAGYQFFDYYWPASYVGGDYYNYLPCPTVGWRSWWPTWSAMAWPRRCSPRSSPPSSATTS